MKRRLVALVLAWSWMQPLSAQVAAHILLQDSPLLSGPALSGAVQADPRSGRDRFTLTAEVVEPTRTEAGDEARR